MINKPHAVTAETTGFFSRDDVTYLEHNCVSSFPSLAREQERQGASYLLPFLHPRTVSFPSRYFSLPRSMFLRFSAAFLFATRPIVIAKITRTTSECNHNAQLLVVEIKLS